MFPITRLGPVSLPTPELIVIVFFYLGITLFEKLQRIRGKNPDKFSNHILLSVFVFIIAGRLGFVFENLDSFFQSPLDIFSLNRDLFDPWIGGAAVAVHSYITFQKLGLKLWKTLDDLTIFFASMVLAGSLANIASGSAFGIISDVPYAIELWGANRFPVQFLDALWNLAIFIIAAFMAKRSLPDGVKFLTAGLFFVIGQVITQGFRAEGLLIGSGFRVDQIIFWLISGLLSWWLIKKLEDNRG